MNKQAIIIQYDKPYDVRKAELSALLESGYRFKELTKVFGCSAKVVYDALRHFDLYMPPLYETTAFKYICYVWGFNTAEYESIRDGRAITRSNPHNIGGETPDGRRFVLECGARRSFRSICNPTTVIPLAELGLSTKVLQRLYHGRDKSAIAKAVGKAMFKKLCDNSAVPLHVLYRRLLSL